MAEGKATDELPGDKLGREHEQLNEAFEQFGMEGVKKHIQQTLNEWKEVPLYVAVTGRSGMGKSSFINAIRGLDAEDDGAAEIGVKECTASVTQYTHPLNSQLVLCDLPGVGTENFSRATYLSDERIGFDRFDMFLLIASDRFMEDDKWLANEIHLRKKAFLFIRTKIGQDIDNQRKARKMYFKNNPNAANEVIETVRADCEENLRECFPDQKGEQKVFLIDNYEMENPMFDFERLTVQLIKDFPMLKRDAFILSLSALTPQIVDAKEKLLRARIWKLCALSAIGGAIPVPGVNLLVDVAITLKEALFYREQFGLEDFKLKKVAESVEMPWEVFTSTTDLKSMAIKYTKTGILQFCSHMAISEGAECIIAMTVPVLGSVIGASISYASTKFTLEKILELMVEDAKFLNSYITEQSVGITEV